MKETQVLITVRTSKEWKVRSLLSIDLKSSLHLTINLLIGRPLMVIKVSIKLLAIRAFWQLSILPITVLQVQILPKADSTIHTSITVSCQTTIQMLKKLAMLRFSKITSFYPFLLTLQMLIKPSIM